jgi:hypothetical protein
VILRVFAKKTQKTPRREIELARRRAEESDMSRKMIPVEESFAAWRKDPEYEKAYDALENEFALAATTIEARARAERLAAATGLRLRISFEPAGAS